MTSQEMMKTKCPAGYCFVNVARVDEPQNWQIQPMPETVSPEQCFTLFGYQVDEFMRKQYK